MIRRNPAQYVDPTRASLLQRVKNPRDENSWQEFFGIYQPLLYRYARSRGLSSDLAEELVQQCMTVLGQKMADFEYHPEKGGFKYWLRRLVNNKINDYFKKRRLPQADSADFRQQQHREATPDELWEQQWRKRHLKYCLELIRKDVAPTTYQAFEYHVLAEWPVEKVCKALNISADQVYTAKSRITRKLRQKMRELLGDEEQLISG